MFIVGHEPHRSVKCASLLRAKDIRNEAINSQTWLLFLNGEITLGRQFYRDFFFTSSFFSSEKTAVKIKARGKTLSHAK